MDEKRMPILEIRNASKIYKAKSPLFGSPGKHVLALNRISLEVFVGEIFGLVGESGSGKTTVGRLIVRLEDPNEGHIYLDAFDISGLRGVALKDFRLKVQMIFQDPYQSLNPKRSVLETVLEPLIIHRIGNHKTRRALVWEAMKSVGLSPPEDSVYRYPHQLSGGQRQRAAIARAMVLKPQLVVADEPTSMLDASISAQIFNILLEMREKYGVTLLFITHSLAAARYLCDRIAVIYRGNLVEIGPAEEVISSPRHPYTQALIDALPKFGHGQERKHYETLLRVERGGSSSVGCHFFPRCKRAHRIRCSNEIPHLKEINEGHKVACFYAPT